jgi:hypothetical protein
MEREMRTKAVVAGGVVLASVAVVWLARWRIVDVISTCENYDVRAIASPDGRRKAVAYTRGCGAPTVWSMNVSVVRSRAGHPHGPGNTFRAEWKRDAGLPPGYSSGPAVAVDWIKPDQLRIVYHMWSAPSRRSESVGPIAVEYDTAVLPLRPRPDPGD